MKCLPHPEKAIAAERAAPQQLWVLGEEHNYWQPGDGLGESWGDEVSDCSLLPPLVSSRRLHPTW